MAQKASPSFQAVDILVTLTPGYLVRVIILVTIIIGGDDNENDARVPGEDRHFQVIVGDSGFDDVNDYWWK